MSHDKHTPGPWHVAETGFSRQRPCPTVYAAGDDLRYIAFCADSMVVGEPTDNLANARLIAAAPDLEANAILARDTIGPWLSAALSDPGVCAEFKAAIETWMNSNFAAIAKATGEE